MINIVTQSGMVVYILYALANLVQIFMVGGQHVCLTQ